MAVDEALDLLPGLVAQLDHVFLTHGWTLLIPEIDLNSSFPWLQIIFTPHCTSPYNIDLTRTTDHLVLIHV